MINITNQSTKQLNIFCGILFNAEFNGEQPEYILFNMIDHPDLKQNLRYTDKRYINYHYRMDVCVVFMSDTSLVNLRSKEVEERASSLWNKYFSLPVKEKCEMRFLSSYINTRVNIKNIKENHFILNRNGKYYGDDSIFDFLR